MFQLKSVLLEKGKPKFLLQEKWLCEQIRKQFSKISAGEIEMI